MTGFLIGMLALFVAFVVLMAVWGRWRRQTGGGFGPSEFSDGSMTTTPTGYPEEMHGKRKKISPTDNNAAGFERGARKSKFNVCRRLDGGDIRSLRSCRELPS